VCSGRAAACAAPVEAHHAWSITSNRDVEEWHPLFGDALLANAAMDRLLHNAHVVMMDGDIYRNRRRPGRRAAGERPIGGWMTTP
jgi:DNA replication protein DnaC